MRPLKRILVPTDWSELSARALQFAAFLARDPDAELIVLYVVPLPSLMYGPPPESYLENERDELCRVRPSDPNLRVRHLLSEGEPAAAILQAARETNADLIVMGTHGRTGLDRLVVGSVAEQVVRRAPCPVLTVRANTAAVVVR
jgi:nucleotide-binding universal stress UspA family protein